MSLILFLEEPRAAPSTTRAANADTCRLRPSQVDVDSNALKRQRQRKKKTHSGCWACANREEIHRYKEQKVLLSTCGRNVPGSFPIVLHPTETTDVHHLYIPTITKQTIKIRIIKKKKNEKMIRASSWSTWRCSRLSRTATWVSELHIQRGTQTISRNHWGGFSWIFFFCFIYLCFDRMSHFETGAVKFGKYWFTSPPKK